MKSNNQMHRHIKYAKFMQLYAIAYYTNHGTALKNRNNTRQ
jgi:hypothetical protein